MADRRIAEDIVPEPGSFDARTMARGVPGVPRRFSWRGDDYEVAEVLRSWKELSDAPDGGGDRYVRRHAFLVRTTDGKEMRLVADRSGRRTARWVLHSLHEQAD